VWSWRQGLGRSGKWSGRLAWPISRGWQRCFSTCRLLLPQWGISSASCNSLHLDLISFLLLWLWFFSHVWYVSILSHIGNLFFVQNQSTTSNDPQVWPIASPNQSIWPPSWWSLETCLWHTFVVSELMCMTTWEFCELFLVDMWLLKCLWRNLWCLWDMWDLWCMWCLWHICDVCDICDVYVMSVKYIFCLFGWNNKKQINGGGSLVTLPSVTLGKDNLFPV
jgi:hypothetical protein